jgi:Hydantoinase B/oxoprolinase
MTAVPSHSISAPDRQPDAVTREVITGKLLATVDEMAIVLARASMSPVIYEVLDFACGICDPRGDLVAQTNGITVFHLLAPGPLHHRALRVGYGAGRHLSH